MPNLRYFIDYLRNYGEDSLNNEPGESEEHSTIS
jgi:hypothetical protein